MDLFHLVWVGDGEGGEQHVWCDELNASVFHHVVWEVFGHAANQRFGRSVVEVWKVLDEIFRQFAEDLLAPPNAD